MLQNYIHKLIKIVMKPNPTLNHNKNGKKWILNIYSKFL